MYILIDNYDSFTWNLFHYLEELGAKVDVRRNDKIDISYIEKLNPKGIIISPGPSTPDLAGISVSLVKALYKSVPILGVCLGHQAIAYAFGAKIVMSPKVMHGKVCTIKHHNDKIFMNVPNFFKATRYHSLIVERESLPKCLDITSESKDKIIMSIAHKKFPIFGLQFHPESIESQHGHVILKNFISICES